MCGFRPDQGSRQPSTCHKLGERRGGTGAGLSRTGHRLMEEEVVVLEAIQGSPCTCTATRAAIPRTTSDCGLFDRAWSPSCPEHEGLPLLRSAEVLPHGRGIAARVN